MTKEDRETLVTLRVGGDMGLGATIALFIWDLWRYHNEQGEPWGGTVGWVVLILVFLIGAGVFGLGGGAVLGMAVAAATQWLKRADLSPRGRVVAALAVSAAPAAVIALVWSLPGFAAVVLPAAFVAACGAWAALFIDRRLRGTPLRWFRPLADAAGVATTTVCLLLLLRVDNLLTAEPAAGFLFPIAAWGSVRAWAAMRSSGRLAVKAAADITASLLLGAVLVIFLVWLANVLDLPRTDIAALRTILARTGGLADLPWWFWAGLYALLAGASLAIAVRPKRTVTAKEWFERLRLVPVANAVRRVASGVHIGLLAVVLVGLAGAAALAPTLRHQLADAYTVALQRQFQAEGELTAYRQITRQFADRAAPQTFTQVVSQVHDTDKPPVGSGGATSDEEELAQRVGALQAAALNLSGTPSALAAAAEADARRAGLDDPLHGEQDLAVRAREVDAGEESDDTTESATTQAGDLAAATLASAVAVAVPGLGGHEVIQIVQEYLSGLVEEGSVKDTFAAWAARLPGASAPPDAAAVIAPGPAKLEHAAYQELAKEYAAAGDASAIDEDQAAENAPFESPVQAAVGMASESAEPFGTLCPSCTPPGGGTDEPDDEAPPADDGE